MKKLLFTATLVIGLTAACGVEPGVPTEFAKACSAENDKKQIETSGFLSPQGSVMCSNTGGGPVRCGIAFKETAEAEKSSINADIERGSAANTIEELQRGYKREDVKIRDNGGNLINLSEKVKITGKMNFIPGSDRCYFTVAKIEK